MSRRLSLRDRVVLVTGGARGIGLEVARAAARRGAIPALVDVDGDAAAAAAAALGRRAIGLKGDVTEVDSVEAAVAEVVDRCGGIDVLVANAGIGPRSTTVDAGDREHQRRVLDVNLHGVWHTAWAGVPHVVERRGHVVIVSSVAAFVASPAWAAYGASKAAVEQLARAMRLELAPTGTSVGVAHFGMIDTAMVRGFAADPFAARMEAAGPGWVTRRETPAAAGEAVVRDVERRRPRTIFPSRWRAPYLLRGVFGPLGDALLLRDRSMRALLGEVRAHDTGGAG